MDKLLDWIVKLKFPFYFDVYSPIIYTYRKYKYLINNSFLDEVNLGTINKSDHPKIHGAFDENGNFLGNIEL